MNDLTTAVGEAIQDWVDQHKNRSLRVLERRSGVSYANIRRLCGGETVNPSESTLLPILSVIMTPREVCQFLRQFKPDWWEIWREIFESDRQHSFENDEEIVLEDVDQLIILKAKEDGGTSETEIIRAYGEDIGRHRLNYLLENRVLKIVNNRVLPQRDFNFLSNPKKTIKRIESAARNFKVDHLSQGAYYHHFAGSMSESDFDKAKDAAKHYVATINDIISNPSAGEQVSVILNIFGDFLEKNDA